MSKLRNILGEKFGRLTVVARSFNSQAGQARWICRCECGKTLAVDGGKLRNGNTKSCGCYFTDIMKTHNMSNSRVYRTWSDMKTRCYCQSNKQYYLYGGRGITVCERWHKFENFLADMGESPTPNHMIERINNDKNYELGNCTWATPREQANNTRRNHSVIWQGITFTLAELSRFVQVPYKRLLNRINDLGWTLGDAINIPRNDKMVRISKNQGV